MNLDHPKYHNPLFDFYDDMYRWAYKGGQIEEYFELTQLAIEDGLIAVDDERFCYGADDLLRWLFTYTSTIQRGLHYAQLILKCRDDCVDPELLEVCESLLVFRWPERQSWNCFLQEYGHYGSCRWPCPRPQQYFAHWCPTMILGGMEQAQSNRQMKHELAEAKAKRQAQAAIASVTEAEFDF